MRRSTWLPIIGYVFLPALIVGAMVDAKTPALGVEAWIAPAATRGAMPWLQVRSAQGARCQVQSEAGGAWGSDQVAQDSGLMSWAWPTGTTAGTARVVVTCTLHGQTARATVALAVPHEQRRAAQGASPPTPGQ